MRTLLVNICRIAVSLTFILSGFVKAVDPLGTQYKLQDYATAWHLEALMPDFLSLFGSIMIPAVEFGLGVCLLFGIRRRLVSRLLLMVMLFFTPLTLWLAIDDPVKDCGCFGDAWVLTNWQTFGKNIALLAMTAVIAWQPTRIARTISESNQWIVINYSAVFILAVSGWSLYSLPIFDFRPYHVGADIRQGMAIPEDAEMPQFETTFILEKDGEQREFTLDNYPDSTWKFVDSRTVQVSEGYVPPIADFSVMKDGEDITEDIIGYPGYTLLLISHNLRDADDSQLDRINELYEYAIAQGYPFYCLTASGDRDRQMWTSTTGAEYDYCTTDGTVLKTMIRSNPGVMLLRDGKVVAKWSHNLLPTDEELGDRRLEDSQLGKPDETTAARKIGNIMLWYVLPLLLLVIADRTWAWSRWMRQKEKKHTNKIFKLFKLKRK